MQMRSVQQLAGCTHHCHTICTNVIDAGIQWPSLVHIMAMYIRSGIRKCRDLPTFDIEPWCQDRLTPQPDVVCHTQARSRALRMLAIDCRGHSDLKPPVIRAACTAIASVLITSFYAIQREGVHAIQIHHMYICMKNLSVLTNTVLVHGVDTSMNHGVKRRLQSHLRCRTAPVWGVRAITAPTWPPTPRGEDIDYSRALSLAAIADLRKC